MGIRQELYNYIELYPPIIARASNMRSPRSVEIDPAYCTGQEGAVRKLQKIFRPGYFAGTTPVNGKYRLLPRTVTTEVVTTSDTTFDVKDSGLFVAGDVLSIIPPHTRYTLTSASTGWAADDTITTTINGVATVVTVVAGDIGGSLTATNLTLANRVIAAVKANPLLAGRVDGLVVAGSTPAQVIVFWATDAVSLFATTAADTGTNGTYTAGAAAMAGMVSVGTVASVDPALKTVTLSGAASVALPSGMPIGVGTSRPIDADGKVLGMISPDQQIDLLYRENTNFGLFTEVSVYGDRVPYWDGELARLYPAITLV